MTLYYTQSIPTLKPQLPGMHSSEKDRPGSRGDGEEFFDLRYGATKNIDVGLDTLVIAQHSSNRTRAANLQTDPLQNERTFLQPSQLFEQKDHRMLHAPIKQRLQTNLTEQKTLRTPTSTIQRKDCILQESALYSLQKRRVNIIYRRPYKRSILEPGAHIGDIQNLQGSDIREFPASTQNKTEGPKGSSLNGPNVLAEGQFRVDDDTQIF
ncbi:hypothetical protein GEV33_003454 [Tenebrio molitor]|uniref:Uncharacterized protein n=1 Tax=Tenebrio molitor TaxID=7067 RepID=A0A8J6LHT1_TENMO|nr:hypothetical protein GEV33_003454 [Tenebrio molitor]